MAIEEKEEQTTSLKELIELVEKDPLPSNVFTIEDKDPMVILGKLNEVIAYLKNLQATINSSDTKANQALESALLALTNARDSITASTNALNSANKALETSNLAIDTANTSLANSSDAKTSSSEALRLSTLANEKADSATQQAKNAQERAETANVLSANALDTAGEANTKAENAIESAGSALITSNEANTKANNAIESAGSALATANEAKTKADNASTISNEANTKADNAIESAGSALATANEAKTKADNAIESAGSALATANEAKTKADNASTISNEANTKADNASTISNEAITKATNALQIAQDALNQVIGGLGTKVYDNNGNLKSSVKFAGHNGINVGMAEDNETFDIRLDETITKAIGDNHTAIEQTKAQAQANAQDIDNLTNAVADNTIISNELTGRIANVESNLSEINPKVARALLTPMSPPSQHFELVAVDTSNTQVMRKLGEGFGITNGDTIIVVPQESWLTTLQTAKFIKLWSGSVNHNSSLTINLNNYDFVMIQGVNEGVGFMKIDLTKSYNVTSIAVSNVANNSEYRDIVRIKYTPTTNKLEVWGYENTASVSSFGIREIVGVKLYG